MYTVEQALNQLLPHFTRKSTHEIPLERAMGRVLAEDVIADTDLPPFANSSMDGYAVRAADVTTSGVELTVIGDIPAGSYPSLYVGTGQAARIMTGAPMPSGADAVVPVENTDSPDRKHMEAAMPSSIRVTEPANPGDYVRVAGEDMRRGQTVLNTGRVLRPADLGVLAGLGRARVPVVRRPRVAILSTGDELLTVNEPLTRGKIRDMNGYTLTALVESLGARPIPLGIARDNAIDVRDKLEQAVTEDADLILSSAGVSVGAYDVVKSVVTSLGALDFWKVNMRPGKPLAFGNVRSVPFMGLPGNPVSAMVTFDVFARPAICVLAGRDPRLALAEAIVEEPIKSDGRRSYLRAVIERRNGQIYARTTGSQSSGVLTSLVAADGLLIVPEDVIDVPVGTRLPIRLFRE